MPHVMADADDNMVDYSSFEHQHSRFILFADESDANQDFTIDIDPLEGSGGLDSDQVAELVAMRVNIQVSPDQLNDIIGQDNAEGSYEFRGSFGSDISEDDRVGNTDNLVNELGTGPDRIEAYSITEPAVFDTFDYSATIPFSDSASSLGGGGETVNVTYTVNMRELYGRGPVLDAADNLTVSAFVIKNNVAAAIEANYSVSLVWDTSTIEGDRRQFSVP